uniref:(northern house mosquito) hypothetical protein n=1 Tax=Culex pipiens TaxID=7175 RepID=A0A8D8NC34_CULPI
MPTLLLQLFFGTPTSSLCRNRRTLLCVFSTPVGDKGTTTLLRNSDVEPAPANRKRTLQCPSLSITTGTTTHLRPSANSSPELRRPQRPTPCWCRKQLTFLAVIPLPPVRNYSSATGQLSKTSPEPSANIRCRHFSRNQPDFAKQRQRATSKCCKTAPATKQIAAQPKSAH